MVFIILWIQQILFLPMLVFEKIACQIRGVLLSREQKKFSITMRKPAVFDIMFIYKVCCQNLKTVAVVMTE